MTTPAQINAALAQLDVGNDNHWTQDGLPRLDTVKMLCGDSAISREQVSAASLGFCRAAPSFAAEATTAPAAAEPVVPAGVVATQPVQAPEGADTGLQGADDATDGAEVQGDAPEVELTPLQTADRACQAARAAFDAAQRAFKAASAALDSEVEKDAMARAGTPPLVTAVQHYHAQQQREAAERTAKMQRLKEVGGMAAIKAILPVGSALDTALARKNGRGAQRPVYPVRR